MFERFTERSRQVVVLAQEEARNFESEEVDVCHILLGLYREDNGLAYRALDSFGITEDMIRDLIPFEDAGKHGLQLPFTEDARKTFELSLREALSLGHNYIGTEHILLGLVRQAPELVNRLAPAQDVRDEVIRMLSGATKNTPPSVDPLRPKHLTVSFKIEPGEVWINRATDTAWYIKHTDRDIVIERTLSEQHEPHDFVRDFRKMGESQG